jgi:hypothetical protein
MVEVFKTNVHKVEMAEQLVSTLRVRFPFSKVNFDLEDCDKILRIEDKEVCAESIIELMNLKGFECEVLN